MIERVGFFQFVETYSDPLGELAKCLERENVRNALIVLPEGFNLGREYNINPCCKGQTREKPRFDAHCMLQFLSGMAAAREGLRFVGAVIDEYRRNCGYFIDGKNTPTLMCEKINSDGSCEYGPGKELQSENPIEVGDLAIGTLICVDAFQQVQPDEQGKRANIRRQHLFDAFGASKCPKYLLCIPAYLTADYLVPDWGKPEEEKEYWVVMANSSRARESYMAVNGQKQDFPSSNRDQNVIRTVNFEPKSRYGADKGSITESSR